MKCEFCGAEFEPRQPNQKYCCAQHRWKAQNRRSYARRPKPTYVKVCAVCGKDFETNHAATKYCSPDCYRAANPSKYKINPVRQATCPICGAEFETNKPNQIYCSQLCCRAAERRRKRLARRGMSHMEKFIPPAKSPAEIVIENALPPEPQPTPIDEFFPPLYAPRKVIIPAAVAENRQPTIEELLDWIFSEECPA